MNIAAVAHRALDNWCYPLDSHTLHLRLQTAADDVDGVEMVVGDPFDWGQDGWISTKTALSRSGSDGVHDIWETEWRPAHGRTKYYFIVTSRGTKWIVSDTGVHSADRPDLALYKNAFIFPYLTDSDLFRAPDWVSNTVWYQIFPERFANGDDLLNPPGTKTWHEGRVTNHEFYGGDLRGLRERLGELESLGVNGLYLTPIFASPSVHKYDTTDYRLVDPAFGTRDDLKRLVDEAHSRGIRVMLDAVFNHCGRGFFAWRDVLAKGRESPYASWFVIHDWSNLRDGTGYETFAYAKGMPKLNTALPAVQDYFIETALFWLRETGMDGWRLDVANEVDAVLWRRLRHAVKSEFPQAYLVGEVWHDGLRWLRGDQFDAVMNYRAGNAVSEFILGTNGLDDARSLGWTMHRIESAYPLPVLRAAFNLVDSHDTDRFLTRCGGDRARARLGWLLLFLLPGSPCVYYGSERGLEGGDDPDNRRCMPWNRPRDEHWKFFQDLIALRRRESRLLNHGRRRWGWSAEQPHVLTLDVTDGTRTLRAVLSRSPQDWSPSDVGGTVLQASGRWGFQVSVSP